MPVKLKTLQEFDSVAYEVGKAINSAAHGGIDLDGDTEVLTFEEFRVGVAALRRAQPEHTARHDVTAAISRLNHLLRSEGPAAIDVHNFPEDSDARELASAANDARFGGSDLDGDHDTLTLEEWRQGLENLTRIHPELFDDAGMKAAREQIEGLFAAVVALDE